MISRVYYQQLGGSRKICYNIHITKREWFPALHRARGSRVFTRTATRASMKGSYHGFTTTEEQHH